MCNESGGEPAVSLSPGFCGSHQVMLAPCVTWTSEVALGREANLQRPWDPQQGLYGVYFEQDTQRLASVLTAETAS